MEIPMTVSSEHNSLTQTQGAKADRRGRRLDDAWQHAKQMDASRQKAECNYCGFVSSHGGISRLKTHLAGGHPKICLPCCDKVPNEVKKIMADWFDEWVKKTKAPWTKEIGAEAEAHDERRRPHDAAWDGQKTDFKYFSGEISQHKVWPETKGNDSVRAKKLEASVLPPKTKGTVMSEWEKSVAMKESQESGEQSAKRGRPLDNAWQHAKPLDKTRQKTQCNYCGFVSMYGGISRLKAHLGGGCPEMQLQGCPQVPLEVKGVMEEWYNEWVTCTLRSCHASAAPKIRKQKRTDRDLSEQKCGRQDEMNLIIQEEFFSQRDKINELKNKNMENERLIVRRSQEMEESRQEKLEAGHVVKEVEHENLKANKIIDELRLEKTESDKVAGLYMRKLEKLSLRIEDVGNLDFPNDADNLDSPSPGVRLTNNSSGLSKKGDRNLAKTCWTREDDAHKTFVTSSGSQSGAHASGTQLMSDKILAEILKIARSSSTSAGGDTEILESDDGESISDSRMNDIKKNSQMKCDELAKTVTLLMDEKNQRDEKIIELENKNADSERLVGVYFEKCESLDIEIVKMGKEIEGLRSDNVELRLKKLQSDQVVEGYKNRIGMLLPRITKIGKDLSDMLNANSRKRSCCSEGRSSGLSMRDMKGKVWGVQMCSGHFSKIEQPSPAAADGDIIEISDDEDELNPDGAAVVANVGESEMNIVQSSSLGQRSKRNRMDVDNLIMCSTATKKRNVGARDEENEKENQVLESSEDRIDCSSSRKCVGEEKAGQVSDYQTPPENLKDDSVSTNLDESCTDSIINNHL